MKLTPALAGGASLAVLVLAMASAITIQMNLQNGDSGVDEPIAPRSVEPLATTRNEEIARIDEQDMLRRPAAGPSLNGTARTTPSAKMLIPAAPQIAFDGSTLSVGPSGSAAAPPSSTARIGRQFSKYSYESRPMAARRVRGNDRPAPDTYRDQGRDNFESVISNPVKVASEEPVSTFSIDVDTASYAFMRASLNANHLPQKNAVRVEELINYFAYDYAKPRDRSVPFKPTVSVFPAPWNQTNKLVHIGIKGFELASGEKPHSNLVFLLDTSGSMNAPNKLPLLRNSMKLLLESLKPDDTVAIVTYAGSAGTVLEPTPVKERAKIVRALDNLHAGGSTAGAEGIRQAYELAQANFDEAGVNRVILATDGDFNVGITDRQELKSFVERKRETGVFLSVLGFGMGNYNDALMQTLAQNGNGAAAYIDNLNEARKVLVQEASSTLFTIAKDVKIQVEFNPKAVAEYRLIGYETRLLNREDFKNDKVDAGDIGSGHSVTAIYEITPRGSGSRLVGNLRYQNNAGNSNASGTNGEYAFLKVRYKLPEAQTSKLIKLPITRAMEYKTAEAAPAEARFAASVAAFGQILTGGRYTGSYSYDDVVSLAQAAKGRDDFGYRAEFINLVRLAKSASALEPLSSQRPASRLPWGRN